MPRNVKECMEDEEPDSKLSFDETFENFVVNELLGGRKTSELIKVAEKNWFNLSKQQKKQFVKCLKFFNKSNEKQRGDVKRLQHEPLDDLKVMSGNKDGDPIFGFSQDSCQKKRKKRMCCPRKRKRKVCRSKPKRRRPRCPRRRKPRCPRRRKKSCR